MHFDRREISPMKYHIIFLIIPMAVWGKSPLFEFTDTIPFSGSHIGGSLLFEFLDYRTVRSIDDNLGNDVSEQIYRAVTSLFRKVKLFDTVLSVPSILDSLSERVKTDYILECKMKVLQTAIPNAFADTRGAAGSAAAFGLLGALMYSAKLTDVKGTAIFNAKLINGKLNEPVWEGEIKGEGTKQYAINEASSSSAVSEVAGCALTDAFHKLFSALSNCAGGGYSGSMASGEELYDPISTIIFKDGMVGKGFIDKVDNNYLVYRKTQSGNPINVLKYNVRCFITGNDTTVVNSKSKK
jgi:hypothetical protein